MNVFVVNTQDCPARAVSPIPDQSAERPFKKLISSARRQVASAYMSLANVSTFTGKRLGHYKGFRRTCDLHLLGPVPKFSTTASRRWAYAGTRLNL
jgi:hypothetical protein